MPFKTVNGSIWQYKDAYKNNNKKVRNNISNMIKIVFNTEKKTIFPVFSLT